MDTKSQSQALAEKRLRELRLFIVWLLIIGGVILILVSFFPSIPRDLQTIIRSLGLSLAPAGIVTLILSRFASNITELLLREAVETSIRDRLEQDIGRLDSMVDSGIKHIAITVEKGVSQIERDMQSLSPLFAAASKLGLEHVHLTRGIALDGFAWFLDAEVQKAEQRNADSRIWIVSSSIKGFLDATSVNFDGRGMMSRIADSGCNIRIMMTDPQYADLRAKQEQRKDGEIPQEVRMNLAYLKRTGIKRESIRFYPGTPTVFAIATTDRMLLNPYPYQTEAFRCFTMIVFKTLDPSADIYHQYLRHHFDEPWTRAKEIVPDDWNEL